MTGENRPRSGQLQLCLTIARAVIADLTSIFLFFLRYRPTRSCSLRWVVIKAWSRLVYLTGHHLCGSLALPREPRAYAVVTNGRPAPKAVAAQRPRASQRPGMPTAIDESLLGISMLL